MPLVCNRNQSNLSRDRRLFVFKQKSKIFIIADHYSTDSVRSNFTTRQSNYSSAQCLRPPCAASTRNKCDPRKSCKRRKFERLFIRNMFIMTSVMCLISRAGQQWTSGAPAYRRRSDTPSIHCWQWLQSADDSAFRISSDPNCEIAFLLAICCPKSPFAPKTLQKTSATHWRKRKYSFWVQLCKLPTENDVVFVQISK